MKKGVTQGGGGFVSVAPMENESAIGGDSKNRKLNKYKVKRNDLIYVVVDKENRKGNQLTMGCQNVRLANCKSSAMCNTIQSHDADILVVTEAWHEPDDNSLINALPPDGYSSIHLTRPIKKKADTLSLSLKTTEGSHRASLHNICGHVDTLIRRHDL